MPEAAKADTKAGAVAFVKWYVELINHAQATGDIGALTAVEDPGCTSCANGRKFIETIYSSDGEIQGGTLEFLLIGAGKRSDKNAWTVNAAIRTTDQRILRPGHSPEHLKGGETAMTFVAARQGAGLVILEWSRAS